MDNHEEPTREASKNPPLRLLVVIRNLPLTVDSSTTTIGSKKILKKKTKKSRRKQSHGADLLNQVIALTGIPAKHIRKELKSILDRKGIDVENLTLDQLRGVVACYLREIMGSVLDRSGPKKSELKH